MHYCILEMYASIIDSSLCHKGEIRHWHGQFHLLIRENVVFVVCHICFKGDHTNYFLINMTQPVIEWQASHSMSNIISMDDKNRSMSWISWQCSQKLILLHPPYESAIDIPHMIFTKGSYFDHISLQLTRSAAIGVSTGIKDKWHGETSYPLEWCKENKIRFYLIWFCMMKTMVSVRWLHSETPWHKLFFIRQVNIWQTIHSDSKSDVTLFSTRAA